MTIQVSPGKVAGTITANASKSAMQRACAAALIKLGKSIISNAGNSDDDKAALSIIEKLGATVSFKNENTVEITGTGGQLNCPSGEVFCGESGLSIRMFTPIAALCNTAVTMLGKGSLTTRPMHFFDEILPQLQVTVQSNDHKLPLTVHGPLQPKDITVDGSLSSQFLTGLLMSYAATNAQDITISVTELKSKPYIDLTLEVLADFGLSVPTHNNYESFTFNAGYIATNQDVEYFVEGDWSGAAFLLVAGAIAGNVLVKGLRNDSQQADKRIIDALTDAGAEVSVTDIGIEIKAGPLTAFEFDATHCPDLFPPLVALAACCKGTTVIKGLTRLKHKESDRGITLQEEFDKLGVEILLNEDEMLVRGVENLRVNNMRCNSHHDHRIAMAIAVATLRADFEVEIRHADAVNKSYPDFYNHLKQLGVNVH